MIASNPTKQIEMMIGIHQLDPCVSNHFESLFVHVASYFLKSSLGGSLPKCWQIQVIFRSSGFARPTETV